MKNLISAFVILLIGGLWSCNPSHSRLRQIDEIMETEPERALTELEQIDRSNMSHNDSAYFALLYTQAQVKCKVMDLSDTLINIAYYKYRTDVSGDLKLRVYYYKALLSYYRGELKSAMKDVIVAYDIAKDRNNPLWIARSAEVISDIYYDVYNYSQAEVYEHETVEKYLLANKIINHRYATSDLAVLYANEGKENRSIVILDSLLNVVNNEVPFDSALHNYISTAKYYLLSGMSRYEELKKNKFKDSLVNAEDSIDAFLMKSDILNNEEKDYNGASILLLKAATLTDDIKDLIRIKYASFRQSITAGDYKKAALLGDTLLMMQTNIVDNVLRESIAGEQRDFYSTKAEYQQRRSELMTYILIGVITVAIIITALLIGMYRLKMRAKKAELEANLSELMRVREHAELIDSEYRDATVKLSEKSTAIESLQKRIESNIRVQKQNSEMIEHLFHEKWQTLNMLCNDYFDLGGNEKTRIAILYNIRQELEKQRSPQNMKEIEEAVNRYMGNLMNMLREECPSLKEQDYTFLSLVFAGMSVRAVCLFMDIKYKLFYLKKSRLAKRIAASDAPHKDLFLRKLGATPE